MTLIARRADRGSGLCSQTLIVPINRHDIPPPAVVERLETIDPPRERRRIVGRVPRCVRAEHLRDRPERVDLVSDLAFLERHLGKRSAGAARKLFRRKRLQMHDPHWSRAESGSTARRARTTNRTAANHAARRAPISRRTPHGGSRRSTSHVLWRPASTPIHVTRHLGPWQHPRSLRTRSRAERMRISCAQRHGGSVKSQKARPRGIAHVGATMDRFGAKVQLPGSNGEGLPFSVRQHVGPTCRLA